MSHGYPRKAEHTAALLAWQAQVNRAWNMGRGNWITGRDMDKNSASMIALITDMLKQRLDAAGKRAAAVDGKESSQ